MGLNFLKKTGAKRQAVKLNESLLNAAKDGNLSGVKAALEKGTDVNTKNKVDMTALMLVSGKGHTEIAKMLIENGANANAKDNEGWTALMYASENGHTEIVSLLRNAGAKE